MHITPLINQCPVLKKAYYHYGTPHIDSIDTSFMGLVRTITAQLLSTKAAQTIYTRICDTLRHHNENEWLATNPEILQKCGLSQAKLQTLTTLATDIQNGTLDLDALYTQSSQDIYNTLIVYKGIGNWTAKGYALMRLHKEDIFLAEDLGVRDGVQLVLALEKRPSIEFCQHYHDTHWMPYGGTATRLLWHFKESAQVTL